MEEKSLIKPGPKQKYFFEDYPIGHEIKVLPLKQSSFKSMLSKFNKYRMKQFRHQYSYEQQKGYILAVRVR